MATVFFEMHSWLNAQPIWLPQVAGWAASSSQTHSGVVDAAAICT